jgi:methylaspartate ammonia-lyase
MLGNVLLRYWNPVELVLPHGFYKVLNKLEFYVERMKEYLHGISERNVLETVFPGA